FQKEVKNADITFQPVDKALKEVLPELANCNVKILLSYATYEESVRLAKTFGKEFDLVVSAVGVGQAPPDRPKPNEGTPTRVIEIGNKGMYVAVVGIYGSAQQPMRYQRVALDSRFKNGPTMKQLMANFQEQLRDLGWQGLGLKPI